MIKDGDDNVLTSERSVKMEGVLWGCDECRNERMTVRKSGSAEDGVRGGEKPLAQKTYLWRCFGGR